MKATKCNICGNEIERYFYTVKITSPNSYKGKGELDGTYIICTICLHRFLDKKIRRT